MKEFTVTSEGRVGVTEETQAAVMERVALGLTRRMRISLCSDIGARELFEGVRVSVGVAGEREGEGEERRVGSISTIPPPFFLDGMAMMGLERFRSILAGSTTPVWSTMRL